MQTHRFISTLSLFFVITWNIPFVWSYETHVGDIQYSLLSEEEFQSLHGKEWELLQGQALPPHAELKRFWKETYLPDARGVFFRCANHNRNLQDGNPEGDLRIGTYQKDAFQSHNHGGGRHQHEIRCELHASRAYGDYKPGHTMTTWPYCHDPLPTTFAENIICEQGEKETRPRNITVNAFVKVREIPAKTSESQDEITRLLNQPEFQERLKNLIQNFP